MSQAKLAPLVGLSQAALSMIESFEVQQSKAVLAICEVLDIAPPAAFGMSEKMQRWMQAGALLERYPESFESSLAFIQDVVAGKTKPKA